MNDSLPDLYFANYSSLVRGSIFVQKKERVPEDTRREGRKKD